MQISIVVPVLNEADNVGALADEIASAMQDLWEFELLFVDDGSTDATLAKLRELTRPASLRVLAHNTTSGQSRALVSGIRGARGDVIVTLDGDGQNDPADIPRLIKTWTDAADYERLLVIGHRQQRRDTGVRRIASRVANTVRAWALGDSTPDTGCGLKVFGRALFLELPYFDHMHRFLPALVIRAGGRVLSAPVSHRPRQRGTSKYGILDRLIAGIVDLFGVLWLRHRGSNPTVTEEQL